jgi:serine/threonine protein kinase
MASPLFDASRLPVLIDIETSASKYLIEIIDRKIVRTSNGQMPELQLRDCFIQRALVSRVVHPALENSPFLISHEDLAPQNIIVDSEYNIKGYILTVSTHCSRHRLTGFCIE